MLTGLSGDGLRQELPDLTRVEMVDESPNTRFSEASDALHEVDPLADGGVWVVVDALLRRTFTKHVSQKSRVTSLLVGHEFNQGSGLVTQASSIKLGIGKSCETVVEEIKLDPLLVQAKGD